jgi:uncharacterized protein (DUF2147 family)
MKKIISICIFLLAFNSVMAQKEFIGKWLSSSKKGIVETYIQGNKLFGKLIWVKTERKDIYNKDESLRNRELKGLNMFSDFSWEAPQWVGGKIYDPANGSTYSCKMWMSDDKQSLYVRGFIGISLLGRTEKFSKFK